MGLKVFISHSVPPRELGIVYAIAEEFRSWEKEIQIAMGEKVEIEVPPKLPGKPWSEILKEILE